MAVNTSFFSDMLQSIADRSRALDPARAREPARERSDGLAELCEALLSGRGEASGVALANEILADYAALTTGPRIAFFETLATNLRPRSRPHRCRRLPPGGRRRRRTRPRELHRVSEPRRLELFRRLNLAPGGTAALVRMREQLIDAMDHRDDLAVDRQRLCSFVLVLVQPRLPGAAPHRLVDAGVDPGKDHPLRGGARDSRLGRFAPPHRSARSPLLRLLPSGAGRRAADLRRGRADPRNTRRDRADPFRQARDRRARSARRRRCSTRSPTASAGLPA